MCLNHCMTVMHTHASFVMGRCHFVGGWVWWMAGRVEGVMEGKREAFGKEGEMDVVKAELSCMTECKFMTFGEGGKMREKRKKTEGE